MVSYLDTCSRREMQGRFLGQNYTWHVIKHTPYGLL